MKNLKREELGLVVKLKGETLRVDQHLYLESNSRTSKFKQFAYGTTPQRAQDTTTS